MSGLTRRTFLAGSASLAAVASAPALASAPLEAPVLAPLDWDRTACAALKDMVGLMDKAREELVEAMMRPNVMTPAPTMTATEVRMRQCAAELRLQRFWPTVPELDIKDRDSG